MKMEAMEVAAAKGENGLLWYATGDYNRANIVSSKGIGKFDKDILSPKEIEKYKENSVLTPDFKKALVAATNSCMTPEESKKGECLLLVLCSVPQSLVDKAKSIPISDVPYIKYAVSGEGIVSLFKSRDPSSGRLESRYRFSQLWGDSKWCQVLEEQAESAGINISVLPASPPKIMYNFQ